MRTYNTIITACNKSGQPEEGLRIYERMVSSGVKPTATTYTALISAYGKQVCVVDCCVCLLTSLSCWRHAAVMRVCKMCSRLLLTRTYIQHPGAILLIHAPPRNGLSDLSMLLWLCCQGKVERAMEIFADMLQRGCERNVITYSSLISACEKAGRWELALQLFDRMHQEGCRPNVVTYNSLIAACSHGESMTGCDSCWCYYYCYCSLCSCYMACS